MFENYFPYRLSAPVELPCAVTAGLDRNPFFFLARRSLLDAHFNALLPVWKVWGTFVRLAPTRPRRCLSVWAYSLCQQVNCAHSHQSRLCVALARLSSVPLGEQQGEATRQQDWLWFVLLSLLFSSFSRLVARILSTLFIVWLLVSLLALSLCRYLPLVENWLGFFSSGFIISFVFTTRRFIVSVSATFSAFLVI